MKINKHRFLKFVLLAILVSNVDNTKLFGQCSFTGSISVFHNFGGSIDCINDYLSANTNATNPQYQWMLNNIPIVGAVDSFYQVKELGDYSLEIFDGLCRDTFGVISFLIPEPVADLIGDSTICQGDSTIFLAQFDEFENGVAWGFNGNILPNTESTLVANSPGVYTSYVYNLGNSCVTVDTIILNTDTTSSAIPFIESQTNAIIEPSGTFQSYQWYKNFEIIVGETSSSLNSPNEGIYNLKAVEPNKCASSSNAIVIGNPIEMPTNIIFKDCSTSNDPMNTGIPNLAAISDAKVFYADSVFSLSGFSSVISYSSVSGNSGYTLGKVPPDFTFQDQDNNDITLYDLQEEIVILDFAASWCSPCIDHTSNLSDLFADLDATGKTYKYVQILFSGYDGNNTTLIDAQNWSNQFGLTIPVLYGTYDLASAFGISVVPTFFVLGSNKKIIKVQQGVNDASIISAVQNYAPDISIDCSGSNPSTYIARSWMFTYEDFVVHHPTTQLINFVPSCQDGILNGDETDVDCGGSNCPPCIDTDNDGVYDHIDNCPTKSNPVQSDIDENGIGDVCDSENPSVDIFVDKELSGLVLKSPSGDCWKIMISDTGETITLKIDCP